MRSLRERYGDDLEICLMDPRNILSFFDNIRYRIRPSRPTWILQRKKFCDGIPDLATLEKAIDACIKKG